MGTLMNLPLGLPEHVNGYVNGGHPPLTYPLTVWGPILEARTGVQIGLHLGPQMDPIQGAKFGSFLVPQNHAHLNATDQVGTSARKRSMSNLMDALMGLQAHPPRYKVSLHPPVNKSVIPQGDHFHLLVSRFFLHVHLAAAPRIMSRHHCKNAACSQIEINERIQ